jgi:hydroxymethylpyrimidine/phosphomethylpyrimidine kinase
MSANRPFVLSIAGFDPTAGAGVLTDIKTFEQHRVYGFAITTANTIQTEDQFLSIQWTEIALVLDSIAVLFKSYPITAVKIGIVPSLAYLQEIVLALKRLSPKTRIVWDTVLKSTTDYDFLNIENETVLIEIVKKVDLITPNYHEMLQLSPSETNAENTAKMLSEYCAVLLKGGHHPEELGVDTLYTNKEMTSFLPKKLSLSEKHGSGCVLSSAIASNLTLGHDLITACSLAKDYIETYLQSNPTKLGYHHV